MSQRLSFPSCASIICMPTIILLTAINIRQNDNNEWRIRATLEDAATEIGKTDCDFSRINGRVVAFNEGGFGLFRRYGTIIVSADMNNGQAANELPGRPIVVGVSVQNSFPRSQSTLRLSWDKLGTVGRRMHIVLSKLCKIKPTRFSAGD